MRKLFITLTGILYALATIGQNPCDAKMQDTITNSRNAKFLKVFSWSKDIMNKETEEFTLMLRKNVKYRFMVGNSTHSETPILFTFIYLKTKTKRLKKQKIEFTNRNGNDTTINTKPVKHIPKGENTIIEKIKIAPGKVSSFDFTIPVTSECRVKISNTNPGYVCTHFTLFFVKKVSGFE
jgi:hypothetical protein